MKTLTWMTAVSALLLCSVDVRAEAPDKKTKDDVRIEQDRQAALSLQQHLEFERERKLAKKRLRIVKAPTGEAEPAPAVVTIEKYIDGTMLVSTPYDLKNEPMLLAGGHRKVDRIEETQEGQAIFQGRVYRWIRAAGDEATWTRLLGKEVTLKTRIIPGGVEAIDGAIKR